MQTPIESLPPLMVDGRLVPVAKYGNGPIPCLFIGPGELYFPSFPPELAKQFTFYSADRYFTYPVQGERVSKEEIQSLTLEKYLEHYKAVQDQLGLRKVAVMGPSAIGLVAHAYAEKYPDSASHVIMLGTPSSTKNLAERQRFFMESNYGPARMDADSKRTVDLTTAWSRDKWKRHQEGQARFAKLQAEGKLSPDESLIKEVVAAQEQYSIEPESEKTLRDRWNRFNTLMRQHFFGSDKMIVGFEMGKAVTVPTLVIGGMYDGIAPYYDLVDKIQKGEIKGPIFPVVLDEAHSPQNAKEFTPVIKAWLDYVARHPKGGAGNDVWLDSVREILIRKDKEAVAAQKLKKDGKAVAPTPTPEPEAAPRVRS